jgi:TRAP-type C4-dicarboxylate transport system permease small subunit
MIGQPLVSSRDSLLNKAKPLDFRKYWHSSLRVVAIALFGIYMIWNVLWIMQGRLAPSLMIGLFKLPGPTTGFTRSIKAALSRQWELSWAYHPLSIPIAIMLVLSAAILFRQIVSRQRLALPPWSLRVWIGLLVVGWICKLSGNPIYW